MQPCLKQKKVYQAGRDVMMLGFIVRCRPSSTTFVFFWFWNAFLKEQVRCSVVILCVCVSIYFLLLFLFFFHVSFPPRETPFLDLVLVLLPPSPRPPSPRPPPPPRACIRPFPRLPIILPLFVRCGENVGGAGGGFLEEYGRDA